MSHAKYQSVIHLVRSPRSPEAEAKHREWRKQYEEWKETKKDLYFPFNNRMGEGDFGDIPAVRLGLNTRHSKETSEWTEEMRYNCQEGFMIGIFNHGGDDDDTTTMREMFAKQMYINPKRRSARLWLKEARRGKWEHKK
tara:strand:- start:692 stop:1108 length:417 start_codon:yes stop_codon:yes gene_type:complete